MNVSLGDRWETFVGDLVKDGRYGSASDVIKEGLRLVEQQEGKLKALREMIGISIACGGAVSDTEIDQTLDEAAVELGKEGL